MARQTSIFQLQGTLGDLCFYKTKNGYFVRRKTSVSKSRIKSDPAFKRVRENNASFARAAQAGKLFRTAFRPLLQRAGDDGVTARLMRTMMKVIQADVVNPRGQGTVKNGQPILLEGFEFNEKAAVSKTLRSPFGASIDCTKGSAVVNIPSLSPAQMITAPEGATHFRLFAGGAAIDFENDTYDLATSESAYLPITRTKTGPIRLALKVKPRSSGTMFLLLGIEFLDIIQGTKPPFGNGRFNALAVVRVDQ